MSRRVMTKAEHIEAGMMLFRARKQLEDLVSFMAGKATIAEQGAVVRVLNRVESVTVDTMMVKATREHGYDEAEAMYQPRGKVNW